MKKILVMVATATMMLACTSTKQTVQNSVGAQQSVNPFGETFSAPITGYVTDEESFGALGISYGSRQRISELQRLALANAQTLIRQQMAHAYKGAITDYMNAVGNNAGTDLESKIEGAGTQLINTMVNDVKNSSEPKFSGVDEKGNMSVYIGIRISKKQFIDKIVDNVSDDEELKIRFKEEQFRKSMEKEFEKYKENK